MSDRKSLTILILATDDGAYVVQAGNITVVPRNLRELIAVEKTITEDTFGDKKDIMTIVKPDKSMDN